MGWLDRMLGREERDGNPLENPTIPLSANAEEMSAFFGLMYDRNMLPPVTIDSALEVPAVLDAVGFLSRCLASLPLHGFKGEGDTATRVGGDLAMLLNEAPNAEWSSFDWRRYTWQQVFTGGRGLTWIERDGARLVGLWPMDPSATTVARVNRRRVYRFDGREYPAADVIDVTYMLKADQLNHYGPISKGRKAISLAIAMNDFAATFFAGGGIPPLALEGPLPTGPEGMNRAMEAIKRTIDNAKRSKLPFFGMPPGHALKPIGVDPDKGQMTEARLFQIQEVARIYGIPPVFLQDLSRGTFANTEQQDLQLVKHTIGQWAKAFEDELNLKLFGQRRRAKYVRHNLDGLMRGDFKSRIEGFARAIQTSQLTPDEARALEERGPKEYGDKLYMQGATVPLGTTPVKPAVAEPAADENNNEEDGTNARTED